mmetsp:Transcript_19087/g.42730  ORF Transcript_19087/g.42730 Transcript_19087/m.42730 type:complete len:842 (+) Transcript_19087:54-2579(+)
MRPSPLAVDHAVDDEEEGGTENDDRAPLQTHASPGAGSGRRSPRLRLTGPDSPKRHTSAPPRAGDQPTEMLPALPPGLSELLSRHIEDNDEALERWARQQIDGLHRQKEQFQDMLAEQRQMIQELVIRQRGSFLSLESASGELTAGGWSEAGTPREPHSRRSQRRRTTRVSQADNPVLDTHKSEIAEKRDMEEVFEDLVKDNKIMAQPAHRKALETLGLLRCVDAFVGAVKKLRFVPRPINRICARMDGDDRFEMLVLFLIVLNVGFIAMASSDTMRRVVRLYRRTPLDEIPNRVQLEEQPAWLVAGDFFFAIVFSVEIIIRFLAEMGHFFVGKNWKWNGLDCAIVASNWMECYLDVINGESRVEWASWIRVFRLVRVLRTLRLARIMVLFRELRLVLLCLAGSIFPLMWALAVFCAILYVFAVIILQGVSSFLLSSPRDVLVDATGLGYADDTNTQYITVMFFSFPRTCLTLLQSVTGGEDWGVVYQQLEKADIYYGISWVLYIMIMIFGVLNVITGIFVESAVSRARNDRENAVQDELAKNKERLRQILSLFKEVDQNKDDKITLEEWEKFAQLNEAKTHMALLGLDVRKTHELFELIDFDGNREVSLQEFAIGCMQLQGGAKSVDVETLLRNSKKVMKKVTELFETVDERLELMFEEQSTLQDRVLEFMDKLEYSGNRRTSAAAAAVAMLGGGGSATDIIASSEMITGSNGGGSMQRNMAGLGAKVSAGNLNPERQGSGGTLSGRHQTNNEQKAKAILSRQKLERRTMQLVRLGEELVAPELRDEFKSAVAMVVRDIQSQQAWSAKVSRSISSELDSLSIRYGLYHHEQKEAPVDIDI